MARRGALARMRELGIDARTVGPGEPADLWCIDADGLRVAAHLLAPLHHHVDPLVTGVLAGAAVARTTIGGRLFGVPRTADVRIWWSRRDRAPDCVATWSELALSGLTVAIPTTGRALSELFCEVVTAHGGAVVDRELRPSVTSPEAEEALAELTRVAAALDEPAGLRDRQVIERLALGRAVAGPLWWSQTRALADAPSYAELDPNPAPSGPYGRRSWLRVAAWTVARTATDVDRAVDAVVTLCGAEAATLDEAAGVAPAHRSALDPRSPDDASQARARAITAETWERAVVPAPPLARLPAVLDALAEPLARTLAGELTVPAGLAQAQRDVERAA